MLSVFCPAGVWGGVRGPQGSGLVCSALSGLPEFWSSAVCLLPPANGTHLKRLEASWSVCVYVCTCVTHSYLKKPAIRGGNESEGVHERSFPEKHIFEGRFQEKKNQPNSTIGMFRLRLCSITLGHHGYSLQLHLSVLPDAQAVGPRQRLAVPQQKAAVSSKPGQQHLGHLTPNSPIINGLDQRALRLHAASVTRARLQAYSRLQARPALKKQENLFFFSVFHTSLPWLTSLHKTARIWF